METSICLAGEPESLQSALDLLEQGQLIVFPTDTVYGVGCLAFDKRAIDRLYSVKDRAFTKAIPVLLGDVADLQKVTSQVGSVAHRLASRFWPGPLTLVVLKNPKLPGNLSPYPTVGVRMPDHPTALELLRLTGPMAVSSANLSNQPSARTAEEVLAQLGGRVPLIIDGGPTPGGVPSTVLDCSQAQPQILREGPITWEDLMAALID
jgi:L-threonylcarbamoyladenylate synthase